MYSSIRSAGSIFWKFFAGFWLTILAVTGLAWTLSADWQDAPQNYGSIERSHNAKIAINSAMGIARWGGRESLINWLVDPESNRRPEVFAINEEGREISGRTVPAAAMEELQRLTTEARAAQQHAIPAGEHSMGPGNRHGMRLHGRRHNSMTHLKIDGVGVARVAGCGQLRFIAVRTDVPMQPFLVALWRTPWWVYLGLSMLVLSFVAWLLASRYSKPIRKLHWAMQQAAQGDFNVRISEEVGNEGNEIGALARQYDDMAERINGLLARQKRLFHDVSHELRSPLARIDVAVALAERNPEKLAEFLPRMEREVAILDSLVDELLTYARLDDNAPIEFEPVDLIGLIESVVDDANFEGSARNVRVTLEAPESAVVNAHVETLMRAVENLIRNALRFSKKGDAVRVAAVVRGSTLTITVTDSGPGMKPEELKTIFEPFVRGKDQPTGNGFGLGLAIARRAVERHSGTLTARNIEPTGLEMKIELPLAQPAPQAA